MELRASSRVPGTSDGTASVTVILGTAAPILTLEAVTTPTQLLTQTITGSYVEPSPDVLEIFVNGVLKKSVKSFNEDSTFSELVTLSAGANLVEVQLTDTSGRKSDDDLGTGGDQPASDTIVVDLADPIVSAAVVPTFSVDELRAGDPFFILVSAADDTSGGAVDTGIESVEYVDVDSDDNVLGIMAPVADVAEVIIKKHGLGAFNPDTTHVLMAEVPEGTAAGAFVVNLLVTDGASNEAEATAEGTVVASLSNRTLFLRSGFNYIGFPVIPDVTSLVTLLDQQVENAQPDLVAALGGNSTLGDLVETIQYWPGGPGPGPFLVFTPGGVTPTLTDLEPMLGLIVKVRTELDVPEASIHPVFDTAPNPTGEGTVEAPIAWNVEGPFIELGGLPPSKEFIPGWNHWTPHAQDPIVFDNVLRGALIGGAQLAVQAITATNLIDAVIDPEAPGGFSVVVEQGFLSAFPGDTLEILRAYFTFLVGDSSATIS